MKDEQLIKELIENGENSNFALIPKVSKEVAAKTICGFLNGDGGRLLIGVSDSGEIIGIRNDEKKLIELRDFLLNEIVPEAPMTITAVQYEQKKLISIEVWSGSRKPYVFNRDIYYRQGTTTIKASSQEMSTLIHDRQKTDTHWERRPAFNVVIEDLDSEEIESTIEASMSNFRNRGTRKGILDFLSYYGLFSNGYFTNAAVVLFAKNPARFLTQCRIRLSYLPEGKQGAEFKDDRILENNLFKNLDDILSFFAKHLEHRRKFSATNWRRQDDLQYPFAALKEGVLNALIHRDYSDASGTTSIIIYPDKLEITNFGRLLLPLAELKKDHSSRPVNPDIAQVVFLRGYIDKIGKGTLNIIENCKDAGLKEPKWSMDSDTVKLTFFNNENLDGAGDDKAISSPKFYPAPFLPDLKFFVGRETLLYQIKETLDKSHRAVIHDISGLGKTFTAYKYAYDNSKSYDRIFFVRATKEEWLESLAKNGEAVDPSLGNVTEQEAKATGFKDWLERNSNWLVIYDNVDLPEQLVQFVPVTENGDCIFTSNYAEVIMLGTQVGIEKMRDKEAAMLLYGRSLGEPRAVLDLEGRELEAFNMLLAEIDGLPITLTSTGAVIFKKQWTFERFWREYNKTPSIAWDSEDPYSHYQNRSAGRIFSFIYDELTNDRKVGKAVRIVLDSVSFISPDEIPEDLLQKILEAQYTPFADLEGPDDFWDDVREKLTAYDLLKYDKQEKTFTTHRAIQRVIQSRLKGKEKEVSVSLATVLRGLFPVYDYMNREECEKYYQHVLVLMENADRFSVETEDSNELFFRLGRYQSDSGNYALAERFHLRAAEISAKISGVESENHARDLNDLAAVYYAQGRYDEAIEKYEGALRIDEKTVGGEHPAYATDLNNLALVYKAQGRYDEAIEKFEEALRIGEKTIGREHPAYATRLNNLSEVYRVQGRYDEAIEKLEEALRIDEKTIGREHPNYAQSLNNLALVYGGQNRYDEAIEKYKEALRIDEKTIGREHPAYSARLNNLAGVYYAQGRYDEAIEKFEEALRSAKKTVGREHPSYAIRLNNLAAVYEARGEYQKALEMYEEALSINEKTLPSEHPYTIQDRESVERCQKKLV